MSTEPTPTAAADAGSAPTEDPRPDGLRSADSVVVVNTGNGKGKSSSAFGMMIRAVARGWKVAVVQFIKSGDWQVGEEKIGRQLGVDWYAFGDGFTWDSDDLTNDRAHAAEGWAKAVELLEAGEHQLVIFDELTYLASFKGDGSLIITTVFTCAGTNALAADQYIAIALPGRMYKDAYQRHGLSRLNLSRTLEDSATLTSHLIPWNTCGAYMSAALVAPQDSVDHAKPHEQMIFLGLPLRFGGW